MMGTTNAPMFLDRMQNTHLGHLWAETSPVAHIFIIIGIAFLAHLICQSNHHFSDLLINRSHEKNDPFGFVTQQPKFVTLTRLIVSAVTFVIYALAILFVLLEIDPTG